MDYRLEDLIDIKQFQDLQNKLNEIYSFPSSIIDNSGKILTATGWQDICTKFHRSHPECEKECIKSDLYILEHLRDANPAISYQCPHGLIDCCSPIIIEGKHLGNFFTGQFFLKEPDLEFFKKQAKKYGFNEKEYLDAVKRVPIWTEKQLTNYLYFIKGLIEVISSVGLKNLKEIEINKKLKESEDRFQTISGHIPGIIYQFLVDKNGNYNLPFISKSLEKLTGKPLQEPVEIEAIFSYIHPDDTQEFYNSINACLKNLSPWVHEFRIIVNNNIKWICGKSTPVLLEDGAVLFNGILLDITEEKQIKIDLKIAKEKAEESDRLKTAFLQNMSHEIRTPMNAIMGFSELLVSHFNDRPKLEYYTRIINNRCNDLLDIINDIIEISRIESGQLTVHSENFKIGTLVSEIEIIIKEFQNRDNKFGVELKNSIPETIKNLEIIADRVKLKQILTNLAENAYKFTEKGYIEINCKINNNSLEFSVADTGIGIPREKQTVIFERFVQINTPGIPNSGGTGLGLSIVEGLLALLGGKIWLESQPGSGSTFYFTFPYKITDILPHEPESFKKKNTRNNKDALILIVEDDLYNAEFLKEVLLDAGYKVVHTIYGLEAIETAVTNEIDLILMDIRLPDISGFEAIRTIKIQKPGIKILAQTAYASVADKLKAMEEGSDDYISKPLKIENLLDKVENLLSCR